MENVCKLCGGAPATFPMQRHELRRLRLARARYPGKFERWCIRTGLPCSVLIAAAAGTFRTRLAGHNRAVMRRTARSRKDTCGRVTRGASTAMTDTELADYRIHDLESFNRTTGEGHEVAGLYFYQQLDCLVDLAYGVACDFFNRPHLYIDVNGLSETLARLHARYGTEETLPSSPQRDMVFLPVFGSGGVCTLPPGVASAQETGDFPALRDDLLKAAQAFAERQSDTGVEMLRQRVKDAHKPMADYLDGLEGDSVKWSRFNALPTLTEDVSYTILRTAGIAAVFGAPPPSGTSRTSRSPAVRSWWKTSGSSSPATRAPSSTASESAISSGWRCAARRRWPRSSTSRRTSAMVISTGLLPSCTRGMRRCGASRHPARLPPRRLRVFRTVVQPFPRPGPPVAEYERESVPAPGGRQVPASWP